MKEGRGHTHPQQLLIGGISDKKSAKTNKQRTLTDKG
jgi:hypothetical protein